MCIRDRYNMSLQNPKDGILAKDVKDAFNTILEKKLIVNKDGSEVNALEGAKIITTSVETPVSYTHLDVYKRQLKDQLSNEKKLNLNTYSFLSDDPFLASIVVFKNAVMTYNADEVYAEVLRVWNDKTAIDVVDANSNVFTVELVRDVDAITSYKIGDVVVLKLMKDTKDKDVKKGCVTKVEIDKYCLLYTSRCV